MDNSSDFQRRLAENRAKRQAEQAAAAPPVTTDFSDLVPPASGYQKTEVDIELDRVVESIGILEAYAKWCGKMKPTVLPGQVESIKISCPVPGHADNDASAWCNTSKNIWHCGACEQGGDTHDLAAFFYGYPVPGYKQGKEFHDLRTKMAQDFGYVVHRIPGGQSYVVPPEEPVSQDPVALPSPDQPAQVTLATVTELHPGSDDEEESLVLLSNIPKIDWQSIVPPESFLDVYMKCCVIDDVAEEYHFWNGLLGVGFALGRGVRLHDTRPVMANLFICILGKSGSGKSKSEGHLWRLLDAALPYDHNNPNSKGVNRVSSPGSAEVLINSFSKPITDPTNPKVITGYGSVTGLIDFNELSGLIGRASRTGSVLKPHLMEFYDGNEVISSVSLTSGLKRAERAYASASTTSQPGSLRTLLNAGDDASGFLNRWLFVAGPEKKRVAIGGAMVDVEPAVDPLKRIQLWAGTFAPNEYMEWSLDAIEVFEDWFHNRFEVDRKLAESDMLTRTDLLMKKIVLLLSANKLERVVSDTTVKAAVSLYDYIKACYEVPEREIRTTLNSEIGDTIIERVVAYEKTHGKGPSTRDLTKSLWRKNYPKELIVKNLENLEKLGLLTTTAVAPSTAGGRPAIRYRYVG